jgi:hypothetical protein
LFSAQHDAAQRSPGVGLAQVLSATFSPTDTSDYNGVSATAHINVNLLPVFDTLSAPTITYGTASTTLSGHIAAGSLIPPGNVAITVNNVTASPAIDPSTGNFSAAFNTEALGASGSPYTVGYAYAGGTGFATASASSFLVVNKAVPTIAWPNPADIVYGTPLGTAQLHASAPVPGTFTYVPTAGGLSSPNYAITYVNGSLVVTPAPVTVQAVGWQTRNLGRKKSVRVLAITFSGPLNQRTALNVNAYQLAAPTTNKKHVTVYSSVIKLSSPLYNSLTNTVTFQPMNSVPKKLLQLIINGSLILDAQSRQLDGNAAGQPGGNYVGMIHG